MLPKLGYFRTVNCPGLSLDGDCTRPYCHFRHSHAVLNSSTLEIATTSEIQEINQKIDKLRSQIDEVPKNKRVDETYDNTTGQPSYSDDVSDTANDGCLPYTPYQGSALLYKPFKHDSGNFQTVDHSKLASTKPTSVLHAARGPSSLQSRKHMKKRKMNYSLSSASKPMNNLEYDPMCNFNLKTKGKRDLTNSSEEEALDDNEVKYEVPEDIPSTDLVIDDDEILESTELNSEVNVSVNEYHSHEKDHKSSPVTVTNVETIIIVDDNLAANDGEGPIVISDSESEKDTENISLSLFKTPPASSENVSVSSENQVLKNDTLLPKKSNKMSVFLFGSDSDNDNLPKFSARKTTSGKLRSLKLKRKSSGSTPEEKSDIAQHPQNKKLKDVNKKHRIKSEKAINRKHKSSAKRKDSSAKAAIKTKQRKLDTKVVESNVDVAKYVDEKEIERLDKDLNHEGIFEECYRIYQEGLDETTSSNKLKRTNVTKTVSTFSQVATTRSNEATEPAPNTLRRSRVAHSAASNSASSLNRTVKQARRTLTPAQKMMQRMETIQLEQEEKLLSAALKRASSAQQKLSDAGRVAHRPSTSLSTSSLSLSRKHVLASRSLSSAQSTALTNKRPFQDLRRPPSSTSTTQGTIVKGSQRVAHASTSNSKDTDVPERPRILPDRHSKVPTNLRQRYLTVFIDECLRIFNNNHRKAYDMAEMEETQCSSRSKTKTIYLSLAASTVKKLREMPKGTSQSNGKREAKNKPGLPNNQTSSSSSAKVVFKSNTRRISHGASASEAVRLKEAKVKTSVQKSMSHKTLLDKSTRLCKGGYSFTTKVEEKTFSGEELYESICRYIMTEDELASNGFPRADIVPGKCKFMTEQPKLNKDKTKKTCARCGKEFVLYKSGQFARRDDECLHHWGRAYSTKVGSSWEKRYSCCQTPIGAEGCSVGETHVHKDNTYDCGSYVKTLWKADTGNPGIFALDCEMAFTVGGLELIRVSVVDFDCNLVYDALVKPSGKILDYNTRWSGLSENDLEGVTTTLRDVQAVLLSKFSSDTILLGHSLESDLKALRIIHSSVVDTSIVFPHRLGPPYKRALRNLMSEHLGIIIQNSVDEGHDSTEDASACVKLMKWKLSEDAKLSR